MTSSSKRFKSLEEAFNLDTVDDNNSFDLEEEIIEDKLLDTDVHEKMNMVNHLNDKLIEMQGFSNHDDEMDELADLAIRAHKDLQDLGMNVEIKHAGEIFSSSSAMLKIAVDAKNLKVEKKLKLLKLQLDKMKIDLTFKGDDRTVEGQAVKLDRNELLKQLKQINENDK